MKEGYAPATETVDAAGMTVAIVASRFNHDVVDRLVDGAAGALTDHGAAADDVEVLRVPGAFEVPVVLRRLADAGGHEALVALAVVIRGETPHFDYICQAVTTGVEAVARDSRIPVGFGVLTTDTRDQALERAGGAAGNKGAEAALAAVATARLLQEY